MGEVRGERRKKGEIWKEEKGERKNIKIEDLLYHSLHSLQGSRHFLLCTP
jgi:hypothetical protein